MLISLQHLFVMIRSFYKYAINRYLRDSLNNFICEIDMNKFYMCININQDDILYVFENTNKWEGWIPIFPIDSSKHLLCFYLISYKFFIHTNFQQSFTYCFIFSECYTWDFRIVPCGFDIRPQGQFITSDWYTCRKKIVIYLAHFLYIRSMLY